MLFRPPWCECASSVLYCAHARKQITHEPQAQQAGELSIRQCVLVQHGRVSIKRPDPRIFVTCAWSRDDTRVVLLVEAFHDVEIFFRHAHEFPS